MKSITHLKILVRVFFLFSFVLSLTTPSYAELTVESYCQLTIEIAQQEVGYLNDLDSLTQKYCDDPNSFLEQKPILQEQFDSNEAALFGNFNTTAEEYDTFMEENSEAVEQYLSNDPNIKQTIDDLSHEIDNLLEKLKVPSYCLLTIATAKQELDNLNELIALAQTYADNPNSFLEQEQIKRKEFDNDKQFLLEAFDNTAHEYLTFMSKNARAVEEYLNNHPHIKQTIDDLSGQVNTLLEEYEALRESIVKVSAGEPPR